MNINYYLIDFIILINIIIVINFNRCIGLKSHYKQQHQQQQQHINSIVMIEKNETSSIHRQKRELKILSRKRRYVAFPVGSSLSAALCTTIGIINNWPDEGGLPVAWISYALNWGLAYNLPNQSWALSQLHAHKHVRHPIESSKSVIKRRSRRDLFQKVELIVDTMGYNGRDCILQALCESSMFLVRKGNNMLGEMLRVIFSFPKTPVYSHEHLDIFEYDEAYRNGRQVQDCGLQYPGCGFSLIGLALGQYSQLPTGYIQS